MKKNKTVEVLKFKISTLNLSDTIETLLLSAKNSKSGYVNVCNTHSLVTGKRDEKFDTVLNNSLLNTADGMPLVFTGRLKGVENFERVDGPNLMEGLIKCSAEEDLSIFLFGNTEETLKKLENKVKSEFPDVRIVGAISPPFGEFSEEQNIEYSKVINSADPDFIFVSLGCPKQEKWMYDNRERIDGIMIGLGAAFDFNIGNIKRPYNWIQKIGLEWLYRLCSEPSRLWKRYLVNNTLFIYYSLKSR